MILGGGAGYPSKTISYGLASGREAHFMVSHVINETLPERVRNLHGHNKDVSLGISPHMLKCTIYLIRKAAYIMSEPNKSDIILDALQQLMEEKDIRHISVIPPWVNYFT